MQKMTVAMILQACAALAGTVHGQSILFVDDDGADSTCLAHGSQPPPGAIGKLDLLASAHEDAPPPGAVHMSNGVAICFDGIDRGAGHSTYEEIVGEFTGGHAGIVRVGVIKLVGHSRAMRGSRRHGPRACRSCGRSSRGCCPEPRGRARHPSNRRTDPCPD